MRAANLVANLSGTTATRRNVHPTRPKPPGPQQTFRSAPGNPVPDPAIPRVGGHPEYTVERKSERGRVFPADFSGLRNRKGRQRDRDFSASCQYLIHHWKKLLHQALFVAFESIVLLRLGGDEVVVRGEAVGDVFPTLVMVSASFQHRQVNLPSFPDEWVG